MDADRAHEERRVAERKHPSRRPGVEPVRSPTTPTAEAVERLTSGELAPDDPLEVPGLVEPLARLAAVLGAEPEEAHEVATGAVRTAVTDVREDPGGNRTLWGGEWDAVGFAGVALLALLAALGRPARVGTERLRPLPLQEQLLLLLVEVELVTPDQVAGVLDAPVTEVHDHLRRLHRELRLPPPPASSCTAWWEVRQHHRLEDHELHDADAHLETCDGCAEAFEQLDRRRTELVRTVPGIGWTHLGRAFAELT